MSDKKITLDAKAIGMIKSFAHRKFMETGRFPSNDAKDIQLFCILNGLEDYLKSQGVEISWKLEN